MPTAEPPGTLPTIEERIDADYLAATLDTATRARLSALVQPIPGGEQHLRHLPSRQLRGLVRQAVTVLQDAGLADTPLERFHQRQLERLAAGDLALAELATRQTAALDRVQANPPPYLVTVLGRPTAKLTQPWRELAGRIESYRLQYGISDPTRALGPRPTGLTQRADRSRIATDLAWSPFGPMPAVHDPTWLNVIDQPDRDPTDALTTLRDPTWDTATLPYGLTSQLLNSPSAILRHHLARTLGLLRHRPPHLTEQRTRLRALRDQLTSLADQPPRLPAAIAGKADQRLAELHAELQHLDQQQRARIDWDTTHRLTLAHARLAAKELRRRELHALFQLTQQPPAWLVRELGTPPTREPARSAWLGGARAIVAYRTTHGIEGPQPLGTPTDALARIHRRITTRQLDFAKQQLQRSHLERSGRELSPQTHIDLADSFDPPM